MAGGRVHADLSVPVQAHKGELRIDNLAHHIQIEAVLLGDARPVMHAGTAQRIDTQAQAGRADRGEIDDIAQIIHIAAEVIVFLHIGRLPRLRQGHALDLTQAAFQQRVGAVLHPTGDIAVGRAAIGWVVLEAAAVRRVVRRGDHNAIGKARAAALVVHQDGLADRRRRGELTAGGDHGLHAIGRQHFQGAVQRRLRQGMGIGPDKQRAADALGYPVITDRLADGQHMPAIEAALQGTAAMPGRAERDTLGGLGWIGLQLVIGCQQPGNIGQHRGGCRLPGQRMDTRAHK